YGIAPGTPRIDSALHEPILAPAQSWENAPPSFSPRLEATLPLRHRGQEIAEAHLLAVDTLNDGVAAYDEYWLDLERQVGPDSARLRTLEEGWGALRVNEEVGVEWYVLETRADGLRLYQSSASIAQLWPTSLGASLPREFQIYPADPDLQAFRQGWLDAEGLQAMARRQSIWLATVTAWLWQRLPAEQAPLVAVRWPAPGQVQAALLLVDPAQPGWQRPQQSVFLEARRRAVESTDNALSTLLSQVDLSRHTLFVTSPLGVDPLHRALSVPLLLRAAGLDDTQLEMKIQGGSGWLRPVAGATEALLEEAATALRAATDPTTEQPLFAQVVAGEVSLYIQAQTAILLTEQVDGDILRDASQFAAPGGPASSPDLAGWWLAVGYRVRGGSLTEQRATLRQLSAAATYLLDVPVPNRSELPEGWFYEP
ncbi:MAG: hypothetical protein H0T73_08430, partial [Ardenticatenales bacterium]|nr:hypothetical protein [Ardenticatenales bacterium]